MILREFLLKNNISLDNKTEMKLGLIVSEKFNKQSPVPCPKKTVNIFGESMTINDYPEDFLKSCEPKIIQFLTSLPVKTNDY